MAVTDLVNPSGTSAAIQGSLLLSALALRSRRATDCPPVVVSSWVPLGFPFFRATRFNDSVRSALGHNRAHNERECLPDYSQISCAVAAIDCVEMRARKHAPVARLWPRCFV